VKGFVLITGSYRECVNLCESIERGLDSSSSREGEVKERVKALNMVRRSAGDRSTLLQDPAILRCCLVAAVAMAKVKTRSPGPRVQLQSRDKSAAWKKYVRPSGNPRTPLRIFNLGSVHFFFQVVVMIEICVISEAGASQGPNFCARDSTTRTGQSRGQHC
jgi:hypothetical protein